MMLNSIKDCQGSIVIHKTGTKIQLLDANILTQSNSNALSSFAGDAIIAHVKRYQGCDIHQRISNYFESGFLQLAAT